MAYSNGNVSIGRCTDYAAAHALWERRSKTPTGRQRKLDYYRGYPLADAAGGGGHVRWVRKVGESIVFRLYGTDMVTYHPDGSIRVGYYASVTTAKFVSPLLPDGLYLGSDGVLTVNGGHFWDSPSRPEAVVCKGQVLLRREDDLWQIDEPASTLHAFSEVQIDRKEVRFHWKRLNLDAFREACHVALAHTRQAMHGNEVDITDRVVVERLFQALADGRYRDALECVPYKNRDQRYAFGRHIEGFGVDAIDWAGIEVALAERVDAITQVERKIMPATKYRTALRRVRQVKKRGTSYAARYCGWWVGELSR